MLIRAYCAIAPGTPLTIELKQGEPIDGRVRWVKDDCVGVTFDAPIDVLALLSTAADGPRPRMPRIEVDCTAWLRVDGTVHRARASQHLAGRAQGRMPDRASGRRRCRRQHRRARPLPRAGAVERRGRIWHHLQPGAAAPAARRLASGAARAVSRRGLIIRRALRSATRPSIFRPSCARRRERTAGEARAGGNPARRAGAAAARGAAPPRGLSGPGERHSGIAPCTQTTRLFRRSSLRWKKVVVPFERQALAFDQRAFLRQVAELDRLRRARDLDARGKEHGRPARPPILGHAALVHRRSLAAEGKTSFNAAPVRRNSSIRLFAGIARVSTSSKPRASRRAAKSSTRRRPHAGSRRLRSASNARLLARVSTSSLSHGP